MVDNFGQAYEDLKLYIRNHPEIEIGESVTSIPESVRAEFYRKFHTARNAFLEAKFPLILDRTRTLQGKYSAAEKKVADFISWEETPEVSRVQRFLLNGEDSLARELFDPLFDQLKGRESPQSFEQRATKKIEGLWPVLFRGGYEKWAVLSLVDLLGPEKVLRVDVRPLKHGERAKSAEYAPWDDAPPPEESDRFFFTQPRNTILTVPDLIIQSAKLNRFVGIRSEFRGALYKASNPNQKREWLPLETDLLILLENDLTLFYLSEEPHQIALIADVSRLSRPDMVVWCLDSQSIAKPKALELLNAAHRALNPPYGTFAVATDPWEESSETIDAIVDLPSRGCEQNMPIRLVTAGFQSSRLLPLVDALRDANAPEMT